MLFMGSFLVSFQILASENCKPTLDAKEIFQAQSVSSLDERWDAILKFVSSFVKKPKSPNGHVLVILSTLPEDQELASSRLAKLVNTDTLRFIDLRYDHINGAVQAWDENYRKQKLIIFGRPNDLKQELALTRIIAENLSHVELVLVSEVGRVFPLDIVQIESKLVNHELNRTLRLYQRVTKRMKAADGDGARAQVRTGGSKPKTYAMDEKVAGPGRNRYEFSIMPGRSRSDVNSPAWNIFRQWIRSTRLSQMKVQYSAHPGFQFLVDTIKRYHTKQKLEEPWWSFLSKTELKKLIASGIVTTLSNDELLSIWDAHELQSILAPARFKYFTEATQTNTFNYMLTFVPPKYVESIKVLAGANSSKFHSIISVLAKDPDFVSTMQVAQKEWEKNEVEWPKAFDIEILAAFHYWGVFRLTQAQQLEFLKTRTSDNLLGKEKYPVHFVTKEKWATQIAAMERAVDAASASELPFLLEEGSYYRRFFNKLKMYFPNGDPTVTPWQKLINPRTLEKLYIHNIIRERPPQTP